MAYEVLSNPEKRRVYDQAGEQGIKDGGFGQQCNAIEIFKECGGIGGAAGAVKQCDNCQGCGIQAKVRQLGPGMLQQIQASCDKCQGLGELVDPDLQCTKCAGKRVSRGNTVLEVGVERGMADGHRIVFDHEGDQASGVE